MNFILLMILELLSRLEATSSLPFKYLKIEILLLILGSIVLLFTYQMYAFKKSSRKIFTTDFNLISTSFIVIVTRLSFLVLLLITLI
jgi:hypothetical protein